MEEPYIKEGDTIAYTLCSGAVVIGTLDKVMADEGQTDGLIRLTDARLMTMPNVMYAVLFVYERHIELVTRID